MQWCVGVAEWTLIRIQMVIQTAGVAGLTVGTSATLDVFSIDVNHMLYRDSVTFYFYNLQIPKNGTREANIVETDVAEPLVQVRSGV